MAAFKVLEIFCHFKIDLIKINYWRSMAWRQKSCHRAPRSPASNAGYPLSVGRERLSNENILEEFG